VSKTTTKVNNNKLLVKCVYCNENISTKKRLQQKTNIGMSCQWCNRALFRCTVCSLYMTIDPPISDEKDKMSLWFTFCLICNHGGHLGHLTEWFK
jgi:hypothetical protein